MVSSFAMNVSAANPKIEVTDAQAQRTEMVYLTVSLANCAEGTTLAISMEYDATVLKKVASGCKWLKEGSLANFDIDQDKGVWTADAAASLNGDICVLAFRVNADAAIGETEVTCEVIVKNGDTTVGTYTSSATVNVVCEHVYGEWTQTVAPKCETAGEERRDCSYCEHYEVRTINKLGHDYEHVVTEPTCTEKGYTTHTCKTCKHSYVDAYTDMLAHVYGEWVHNDEETHKHVCKSCQHVECEKHAWDNGKVTKEPTYKENGVKTYTCATCKGTKEETISKLIAVSSIAIEPTELTLIEGKTEQLKVFVLPENAENKAVIYTTSDATIATVSEDGVITAIKAGTVTITVTAADGSGITATCKVTVKKEKIDNPFTDVKESDGWYYEPVLWAVDNGITTGLTSTTFGPNKTCTRGQIVTFLWRAMGCPEPESTVNPFKDVPKNEYYTKAVLWALENGITTGLNSTTFGPEETCTRAQVVTFLWRAMGKPEAKTTSHTFKDVAKDYYTEAVLWALEEGITTGLTSTKFGTNDACTRAHVVTFLYRTFN